MEAVEGIETIKSGSGAWRFLSRWVGVNGETINSDLKMRHATESVGYLAASVQQISYALLVVVGALVVMQGHMTQGALIASSILSGRILAPIMALPGLMVQSAHAKAELEGLERLYLLKTDHQGVELPLTPDAIQGHYELSEVKFSYGDNPPALVLPKLSIQSGERIGSTALATALAFARRKRLGPFARQPRAATREAISSVCSPLKIESTTSASRRASQRPLASAARA